MKGFKKEYIAPLLVMVLSSGFYIYALSFGKEWVGAFDAWYAFILGVVNVSIMGLGVCWYLYVRGKQASKPL